MPCHTPVSPAATLAAAACYLMLMMAGDYFQLCHVSAMMAFSHLRREAEKQRKEAEAEAAGAEERAVQEVQVSAERGAEVQVQAEEGSGGAVQ
jgi:hypothetical protein